MLAIRSTFSLIIVLLRLLPLFNIIKDKMVQEYYRNVFLQHKMVKKNGE